MAEKKPLSLEAGVPTQLSSSDTLPAANMPYAMNQAVATTSTVTFASITQGASPVLDESDRTTSTSDVTAGRVLLAEHGVNLGGTQTITGAKTFSSQIVGSAGAAITGAMDVAWGGYQVSGVALRFGADIGNVSTRTNATRKIGVLTTPHYLSAEEDFQFAAMDADSGSNGLLIGGGFSTFNTATLIRFFTAADSTTVSGTERLRIDNEGIDVTGAISATGRITATGSSTEANNVITGANVLIGTALAIREKGDSAGIGGATFASQIYGTPGGGNIEIYTVNPASKLVFGTSTTERVSVTNTGMDVTGAFSATTGASTGVGQATLTAIASNTVGDRAGFGVVNSAGGSIGGLAGQIVTGGAYPDSVGFVDIFVQNGFGTVVPARFTATGVDVTGAISATTGVTVATGQDVLSAWKNRTAYTPTMSGSGGSAGSFAATVDGEYTRAGAECTVAIGIANITNKGSWTGEVRISLPFPSVGAANFVTRVGSIRVEQHGYVGELNVQTFNGVSYLTITQSQTSAAMTLLNWTDIVTTADNRIFLTLKYTVA